LITDEENKGKKEIMEKEIPKDRDKGERKTERQR
jgi:hypothetical protein